MTKQPALKEARANVTREGIEVRVGQVWEDLDKRMSGRRVIVTELVKVKRPAKGRGKYEYIPAAKVRWWSPFDGAMGHETTIAVRRMHKNSTGFKLIKDVRSETARKGQPEQS